MADPLSALESTRIVRQGAPRRAPEPELVLEPIAWTGRESLQECLERQRGAACQLATWRGSSLAGADVSAPRGMRVGSLL